ncbi:polysaccharide biosynthesis C-terminal domain-containing protein [Exiguobacterium sp. SL14]|nr:polysaccharide biosynthesis C-terminal domain-containing protein [Exiguobacterium sp. SL14]MCY1692677.1 polysaccharide biosynthesis C-terminal domain-containing protein [Exiguobacterium sp. SL14]
MRPLNIALYQNDEGTVGLIWLAATAFAASIAMMIVSCLQSVDAEKYALVGVLVGLGAKLALNLYFIPRYGMIGAGMATFGGFAVMAAQWILLNLSSVAYQQETHFIDDWSYLCSPWACFFT